jgi:hypothetical protein
VPGDPQTRSAMLDILLGPTSPIQAVRFGDGSWQERGSWPAPGQSAPMPEMPDRLKSGPIADTPPVAEVPRGGGLDDEGP